MMNLYLEYLNKHIDKVNKSFDLDQFQSGKFKKLLIVGIPASGKTSTSHILEKKYNIKVFHTDDAVNKTLKQLTGIGAWDRKKQAGIKKVAKETGITGDQFWLKVYKDNIEPILKNNQKMIVEGTLQYWYGAYPKLRPFLIKFPCIIMGKSIANSWKDRAVRDNLNKGPDFKRDKNDKLATKPHLVVYAKDKKKYSKNIKKWDDTL